MLSKKLIVVLLGVFSSLVCGCSNELKVGVFNSPPDVAITSHGDGDVVTAGNTVTLSGVVSDPDGAGQSMTVVWTIDGAEVCLDAEADELGMTNCQWAFSEYGGAVSLQAWDRIGASVVDSITLTVLPNDAPVATILSPVESGVYYSDNLIAFEAEMSDIEDLPGDLVGTWESSIDGSLNLGSTPDSSGMVLGFSTLTVGNHAVTFTATDSAGKTATDSVIINVGPPNSPPFCAIVFPQNNSAGEIGKTVSFEGLVGDADLSPDQLLVSWSSDIGGHLADSVPTTSGDVSFVTSSLIAAPHTITLTVEDEVGATCTDAITYTIGSPPSVAILKPQVGDQFMMGNVVTFEAAASDPDDAPPDLSLEWESDLDGVFSTQGATSSGIAQFTDGGLTGGTHTVTVTVTDTSGLFAQALTVFDVIPNVAPTIASTSISPDPAFVSDALTCAYSGFVDLNGDPDLSTFEWTLSGVVVGSSPTLSGVFSRGDNLVCTVTPNDGKTTGVPVSATRSISNSLPSISTVSLSPKPAYNGDVMTCSYTGFSDADGDGDASRIEWSINGVTASSGSVLGSTLIKGDTVKCTVTPNDGIDDGVARSDSLTVGNAGPSVINVAISPDPAFADDTLTCGYTFLDADADVDHSVITWSTSGMIVGMGPTLAGVFTKGDVVTCTVTPNDGTVDGTPVTDDVFIGNTAPEVTTVQITPDPAFMGDVLTCGYLFMDDDGDADSSSVQWTKSGQVLGFGPTLSGGFDRGDVVVCTVTPNDGTSSGASVSDDIVIDNSLPVVTDVMIAPNPATVSDSLSCLYTFSDVDNDSDNSVVSWFLGSMSLGTGTSLMAGLAEKGDLVTCTVTPHDGTDSGLAMSASIVIENTTPVASGVVISPKPALVSDVLSCAYSFSDDDNDVDASTIAWTVGAAAVGNGATLAGVFSKGDTVTCTVTPHDGIDAGMPVSDSVMIENTVPVVSNVSVTPNPGVVTDTLTCSYSFSDVDGDSDVSAVEWTVGSVVVGTGTTLAGQFSAGDMVTCTVTPHDGTVAGVSESDSALIENSAPTVLNVLVSSTTNTDGDSDSQTAVSSDTLECAYTFTDVDGDSDNSSVEWSVGSVVVGSGATLTGAFVNGDTVTCTVTPNDGSASGAAFSDSILVGNRVPAVSAVMISPDPAIESDTLTCGYNFSDADGDSDASLVAWTVGSVSAGTSTTLSGVFVKGDMVTCTVTPNDGMANGVSMSDSITIGNTAPTVANVTVTPNPAVVVDTLTCVYSFSDVDSDSDASLVEWTVDGVFAGDGTSLSGAFDAGDTVTCTVTPNDGTVSGAAVSDSLVIDNMAPSVSMVSVTSSTDADSDGDVNTAVAVDTLVCAYTYSDLDNDADASTMAWTVGGTTVGTGATLSGAFDAGDTVTCTVTPNDGKTTGTAVSASMVINNEAPVVSGVTLTSLTDEDGDSDVTTAVVSDTLECAYSYSDADGDADASTLQWTVNGSPAGTGTTLAGAFAKGDTVTCTVTANDGSAVGSSASAAMVIGNTTPSVATVSIAPNPADATDTLTCSYSFADMDSDSDASLVEWTVDGVFAGDGTSLSGAFDAGDTVTCTVTPNDGTVSGAAVSDSLVIDNTAPSVSLVSVTSSTDADSDGDANTAVAADTLVCAYTYSDLDNDADASTMAWTVGGATVGTGATLYGAFVKGDTVTCTVTPNDGKTTGTAVSVAMVINNQAPVVSAVSLTSVTNVDGDNNTTTAVVGDTLECVYIYDDSDGDADSSTRQWTVNGAPAGSGATLAGAFMKGDTVTCTVTANDGTTFGSSASASMVIDNMTPSVVNVSISPNPADANDTLTCSYAFADMDLDADTSLVKWTLNSVYVGNGSTLAGVFGAGDTVMCTVTPNDGTSSGAAMSDSLVIDNLGPSVSLVSVTSSTDTDADGDVNTAVAGDTLVCSYSFNDLDGDADASTVQWTVGGTLAGTGTTLSGVFSKGDTVTCTVTPNDGTTTGVALSDSITIDNQSPLISDLTLTAITNADGDSNPATAVATDTLECGYTFDDADGDGDLSSTQWTIGGVFVGTGLNLSGLFMKGDVVTCTVTPRDGSAVGSPVSASLVIGNAHPLVVNVNITPDPAAALDTLTCSYTFSDADLFDTDLSYTAWTVNGFPAGIGSTLSGVFAAGDNVACTVVPNDGSMSGLAVSDSIVIENMTPSVSLVKVTSTTDVDGDGDAMTAVASDTLSCTYTFNDLDGDPNLSTTEWSVQGIVVGTGTTLSSVFSKGDAVTCTVTPMDGTVAGTPVSDTMIIGNQAPQATSVSVTATTDFDGDGDPTTAVASDVLTCIYVFDDADTDSDSSAMTWTVGGVQVGTGTTLSGAFLQGDTVTCTVTPKDGTTAGSNVSASMVIDSTAPSVSGVYITPDPAGTGDTLTCHYSFTDPDFDSDQSTIEWTIQGALVGTSATLSGVFQETDVVVCTVTPRDNSTAGAPVSASVYIGANIPLVANVKVTPQDPTDLDVLECTYDFIDGAGNPDESHVVWYVNGYKLEDQVKVSAGYGHHCSIDANGVTECWGADTMGQATIPAKGFIDIAASEMVTCGVDETSRLECWGFSTSSVFLNAPSGYYKDVSVGSSHGCAITNVGTITCWGDNTYGQTNRPSGFLGPFTKVTSRKNHSCALAGSGSATCWGDNSSGQTDVPSGVSFADISTGYTHTCGVTTAGELRCWGSSSQGQSSYPLSGVFTKVSTFDDHSCALDDVGAIHCWGRDLFGYGTLSDAPTGKGYVDVSSGYAHSCAINENGAISCWGNDANGQVAGPPSPQQEDGYLDSGFDVGDIVWCEVTADNGITVGNTQTSGAVVVTASLPDPSDTCAEVMTQPYLPPGSYHWVVVNFQETVTLAPANLCTGYYSGGPDVLFRVRLRPGQTLDVGLEVTSPTNWVYDAQIALMSGCDDSWSQSQWMGECVAGKDSLNSPETLVYTNDTGFDEELTLALTKRSPNMGGLNFFADVDIY